MKLLIFTILLISITGFTYSQNDSIKIKTIECETKASKSKLTEIEKVIQEVETIEDIKLDFPIDKRTFRSIGVVLGSGIEAEDLSVFIRKTRSSKPPLFV